MYTRHGHFIALDTFAVLIKYVSEETANRILSEMRDVKLLLEHKEREKLDRYYPPESDILIARDVLINYVKDKTTDEIVSDLVSRGIIRHPKKEAA